MTEIDPMYTIKTDGTPQGTKLFTRGGYELKYIKSLTWKIGVGDPYATAVV